MIAQPEFRDFFPLIKTQRDLQDWTGKAFKKYSGQRLEFFLFNLSKAGLEHDLLLAFGAQLYSAENGIGSAQLNPVQNRRAEFIDNAAGGNDLVCTRLGQQRTVIAGSIGTIAN